MKWLLQSTLVMKEGSIRNEKQSELSQKDRQVFLEQATTFQGLFAIFRTVADSLCLEFPERVSGPVAADTDCQQRHPTVYAGAAYSERATPEQHH